MPNPSSVAPGAVSLEGERVKALLTDYAAFEDGQVERWRVRAEFQERSDLKSAYARLRETAARTRATTLRALAAALPSLLDQPTEVEVASLKTQIEVAYGQLNALHEARGFWRCFHCAGVFRTREAAVEHFGIAQFDTPGCIERVPDGERTLLASLRAAEARNRELLARAQKAEMEHEMDAGLRAELRRYFGHSNAWGCWNVLDGMKGRALAAEEHVQRLLDAAGAPPAEYLVDRVEACVSSLLDRARDGRKFSRVEMQVEALRESVERNTGVGLPLRDALVGQRSGPTFYTAWERNKAVLVELLNALDDACPLSPSPSSPVAPEPTTEQQLCTVCGTQWSARQALPCPTCSKGQ